MILADPAGALASRVANGVLERETWAREKLAQHSGRSFAVRLGPMESGLRITGEGILADFSLAGATPDLWLTVSLTGLPSFLADPRRWSEFVTEAGDLQLAATLRELAATLPWFVEQWFARAFGAVAGQRLADAGRRLLAFPEYAAARLAGNAASYASDEVDLLPRGAEMRAHNAQVDELAARTARLADRIASLESSAGASAGADHRAGPLP